MITRTVLVKLKDEWATPEGRTAVARHSQGALAAIPGVTGAHSLIPADLGPLAYLSGLAEIPSVC